MNDPEFDRLTRRFVVAGLAGGSLATFCGRDEAEAKKTSKRKRCRKKKRTFCAGRCCPKHHRCQHGACVRSCGDPMTTPTAGGGSCGGDDSCFCATSITGAPACLAVPANPYCPANPWCSPTNLCPSGMICGTCGCGASECDYRCYDPCPPG